MFRFTQKIKQINYYENKKNDENQIFR